VPAGNGMGQGVVVFVRLMVMPPAETATLAGLSALERAAALSGARRRSRTGNVRSGRCAATPAGRTPGAGNGSPAGPIQNRFECSIVDPTVIALLGRAAAALVARQRGAVLADCPHLARDANRTG